MPNRYSQDGGQDWWSANSPEIVKGPMQTQAAETGGIAGLHNTVAPSAPGAMVPGTQPAGFTPGPVSPPSTTWNAGQGWTGTSAVGGPEQFGGDYQKWFMSLVGDRPWNQATLTNLMPTLQHYGINLTPPNASGDQTKIQLPNGSWVRVGFGEGHPVWIPQGAGGGTAGMGGTGGASGYSGPGAIPPPFQAPSFEDLQKEPGFQARIAMGQQGLERSAAAQGSLLSGGTQKALARYNQDFATNEYGSAYNRAFNTYMGNYQTQSADPWARYRDLYQGGLQAGIATKTNTPVFSS